MYPSGIYGKADSFIAGEWNESGCQPARWAAQVRSTSWSPSVYIGGVRVSPGWGMSSQTNDWRKLPGGYVFAPRGRKPSSSTQTDQLTAGNPPPGGPWTFTYSQCSKTWTDRRRRKSQLTEPNANSRNQVETAERGICIRENTHGGFS